jgi:F-type H+-transporting ATPase subunit a
MPIFFIVGVIEIISILFRPMTLSLRLYGNVFAGENLLHTMGTLVKSGNATIDFLSSVLIPLPFYFLELLVGVLQGMVFALLVAVFIKLSTTHDEEHGEEHAH